MKNILKGRLVNVISYCTECPMPTLSVYTSTKAALKTLSDAMRMELVKYDVDVVLFNPGDHPTETPLCSGQEKNYQVSVNGPFRSLFLVFRLIHLTYKNVF